MSGTDSSQAANWREGRRIRAWELKKEGWKQRDIALALGVSAGAVSQWLKRGREGGVEGLRRKPHPGAPPRLRRPTCQAARVASPRRTGLRLPWRCVDLHEGDQGDL
jgi:transposase